MLKIENCFSYIHWSWSTSIYVQVFLKSFNNPTFFPLIHNYSRHIVTTGCGGLWIMTLKHIFFCQLNNINKNRQQRILISTLK